VVQNGLKMGGWGVKMGENEWMGLKIGNWGGWRWKQAGGVNVGSWWLKMAASLSYMVGNIPLTRRGAIVVVAFIFVIDP